MQSTPIRLSEIFFSIEGEGRRIGVPTLFVRLQGCPFNCSYCDTPYARSFDEGTEISETEFLQKIKHELGINICTCIEFTGGSPDFYDKQLFQVIKQLPSDIKVVRQISGGINNGKRYFNQAYCNCVDYKSPKEGIPMIIPLKWFRNTDELKFVVDGENYSWVVQTVNQLQTNKHFKGHIVITAASKVNETNFDEVSNWKNLTEKLLNDTCLIKSGRLHILPRLQQLYWPKERGK